MLKPLSAIFLFCCLTAPFLGTYSWLKIEKRKVKKSIKWRMIEGMDKSELVLLKFTREESQSKLRWVHAREFEWDGEMYDIVEKNESGDTISYWCWWDYEETQLNRKLRDLVANAMGQNPLNKERQERLSNFLKNLYCQFKFDENLFTRALCRMLPLKTHIGYSSIYFSPPSPPPEIG